MHPSSLASRRPAEGTVPVPVQLVRELVSDLKKTQPYTAELLQNCLFKAAPELELRARLEALLTTFRVREAEWVQRYQVEPEPYLEASGDVYSVVIHELEGLL